MLIGSGKFSVEKLAVSAFSGQKRPFFNGNSFTRAMHLAVEKELFKLKQSGVWNILGVFAEKAVLLQKKGSFRRGRFDFFVETSEKKIGFEVLSRPTRGKLKKKLSYALQADEFVFVLPTESLKPFQKPARGYHELKPKKRFLGKEFSQAKLVVWLFDSRKKQIVEKLPFSSLFNTVP